MKTLYRYSTQLAWAVAAVLWLFYGNEMAGNLFKFVTWFLFAVVMIAVICKQTELLIDSESKPLPSWFVAMTYLVSIVACAAAGHFGYATMLAIVYSIAADAKKEALKKKTQAEEQKGTP